MTVIPSINATDFEVVKSQITEAKDFGAVQIHLDISDGTLTKYRTWNNSVEFQMELQKMRIKNQIDIGVHLMVSDPDDVFEQWIEAGVRKIIVHVETVRSFLMMKQQCDKAEVELVLAVNPKMEVQRLMGHNGITHFMILAVEPGPSGQKFQDDQLEKIKTLREIMPNATIEVDGGINVEVAQKVKEAGADSIIAGAYIWNDENPSEAFKKLKAV
ncbi:MAG: hypothetical protein PHP03_03420 [Candidatus Pacebacteria bacterium]|nr:hypothetical protein [Candidatus Paceibacterota bacterium]